MFGMISGYVICRTCKADVTVSGETRLSHQKDQHGFKGNYYKGFMKQHFKKRV